MQEARCAWIATLAIGAAGCLFAPPAQASHRAGSGPPYDLVRGVGENIFNTQFVIDVRSGRLGENPRGHFSFQVPGLPPPFVNEGTPTCLRVDGNRATFGGRLHNPVQTPAGPVGAVIVTVTDSRDPTAPDGVTFWPVASAPAICPPPIPVPDDALVDGDVVVHDR
jgi:hypothetical protein